MFIFYGKYCNCIYKQKRHLLLWIFIFLRLHNIIVAYFISLLIPCIWTQVIDRDSYGDWIIHGLAPTVSGSLYPVSSPPRHRVSIWYNKICGWLLCCELSLSMWAGPGPLDHIDLGLTATLQLWLFMAAILITIMATIQLGSGAQGHSIPEK